MGRDRVEIAERPRATDAWVWAALARSLGFAHGEQEERRSAVWTASAARERPGRMPHVACGAVV